MGERRNTRYFPPDFDPRRHGSLDRYQQQNATSSHSAALDRNQNAQRRRKFDRELAGHQNQKSGVANNGDAGTRRSSDASFAPVIRFELPHNGVCEGCGAFLAAGVRYNAEKHRCVERDYGSVKAWRFCAMRCRECGKQEHVVETDPRTGEYVYVSGIRKNLGHAGALSSGVVMNSSQLERAKRRESERAESARQAHIDAALRVLEEAEADIGPPSLVPSQSGSEDDGLPPLEPVAEHVMNRAIGEQQHVVVKQEERTSADVAAALGHTDPSPAPAVVEEEPLLPSGHMLDDGRVILDVPDADSVRDQRFRFRSVSASAREEERRRLEQQSRDQHGGVSASSADAALTSLASASVKRQSAQQRDERLSALMHLQDATHGNDVQLSADLRSQMRAARRRQRRDVGDAHRLGLKEEFGFGRDTVFAPLLPKDEKAARLMAKVRASKRAPAPRLRTASAPLYGAAKRTGVLSGEKTQARRDQALLLMSNMRRSSGSRQFGKRKRS